MEKKAKQLYIAIQNLLPKEIAMRNISADIKIAQLLGVPEHIGLVEAVKEAKKDTGIDYSNLLITSNKMDNVKKEEEMLEPTELGEMFGISAIKMNRLLARWGWQRKEKKQWLPTEIGKQYSSKHAWAVGAKSGYNLKWNVKAIKENRTDFLFS